ncbi:hypothetical protein [Enterobacter soli]|uniref:hypothetical protein n=1 Tax=Enterobacter soli TaxID=885040 RepID=UPI0034CFF06A
MDKNSQRVIECNIILNTLLNEMQSGFLIRTNSSELKVTDKKIIKKVTKDVARHVDGILLKAGM